LPKGEKLKSWRKRLEEKNEVKKKKIAIQDLTIGVSLFTLIPYNISKSDECRMPVRS
jgi:hypothetical protein